MEKYRSRTELISGKISELIFNRRQIDRSFMDDFRLRFQKGDLTVLAAILLLAILTATAFLSEGSGQKAQLFVYQNGVLIEKLPLDADKTLSIGGDYQNVVAVRGGRAAIVESGCPGGDCVRCGWISRPGRSVVCLPNRVELRIVAKNTGGEVDATTG